MSGVWSPEPDPKGNPSTGVEAIQGLVFPRYFANITADLKLEEVPFQPDAKRLFEQRLQNRGKDDPLFINETGDASTVLSMNALRLLQERLSIAYGPAHSIMLYE